MIPEKVFIRNADRLLSTSHDVYSVIAGFLNPDEAARNERVCRAWQKFSNISIWKQQYQQEKATTTPNVPQELLAALDTHYQNRFSKALIPLGVYRIIVEYMVETPPSHDREFYKRAFSHPHPNILSLTAVEWNMAGEHVDDTRLPWYIHRKIVSKPFPSALLLIPQMVNGKYFASPGQELPVSSITRARGWASNPSLFISPELVHQRALSKKSPLKVDKSYYVILSQQVERATPSWKQTFGESCRAPAAIELLVGVIAANIVLGKPLCDHRGRSLTGDTNLWTASFSRDNVFIEDLIPEPLAVGCTHFEDNEDLQIELCKAKRIHARGTEHIGFRGVFEVVEKPKKMEPSKLCLIQ